ncbi:arsenic resistance protein [Paenibacillus yanchengensis]|uniref:Arsenic resistance protein n=1 Tax=Paenibacillus yanchengensis TaxID=2035833 RepID=A0ABW4YFZ4_9BACL
MALLEKMQTLIIMLAIGVGLLLGQSPLLSSFAEDLIIPFLFLMLYGLFLTIPLQQMKAAFFNIRFLCASIVINFIWTPLLAFGLGAIFLTDQPALWIGFIMLMVTPCTDWYLMFTSIAKGNVALSTAILPVNLLLQVILLPLYLLLFTGTIEPIPMATLLESIILVLVIPFVLAHGTRFLSRKHETALNKRVIPFFAAGQTLFLSLAIACMFASQGAILLDNLSIIYTLIMPVLLFFAINYFVGHLIGKWLHFSYADTVSLELTIIARNSPVALAIAVTVFPDQPLIALALVVGPLIELPVLTFISQLLLRTKRKSAING